MCLPRPATKRRERQRLQGDYPDCFYTSEMPRIRAALVLVCGVLLLSSSAPAHAEPAESDGSLTIRLVSTPVSNGVTLDRAPRGAASKGDVVWIRSVLRNQVAQLGRPSGAVVGRDYAVFTFLTARVARVDVRAWLPGGTLRTRVEGDVTHPFRSALIVGGTARFKGARGTHVARDHQGRSTHVYRVRLP